MGVENFDNFKYPFWGAKNGPFFDLAGVVLLSTLLMPGLLGSSAVPWHVVAERTASTLWLSFGSVVLGFHRPCMAALRQCRGCSRSG